MDILCTSLGRLEKYSHQRVRSSFCDIRHDASRPLWRRRDMSYCTRIAVEGYRLLLLLCVPVTLNTSSSLPSLTDLSSRVLAGQRIGPSRHAICAVPDIGQLLREHQWESPENAEPENGGPCMYVYVCMYVCPKIYIRRALNKVTDAPQSQTNKKAVSYTHLTLPTNREV